VVKAAVELANAWMPYAESSKAKHLLGDPMLAPLSLQKENEKDLFLWDSYFEQSEDDCVDGQREDSDQGEGIEASTNIGKFDEESASAVHIGGLCRLLLSQSFPTTALYADEILPFRSGVLQSFEHLLKSLPDSSEWLFLRRSIFSFAAPRFLEVFGDHSTKESPLIVARTINCFTATLWTGVSFQNNLSSDISALMLIFLRQADFVNQVAWTVREAAARAVSRLAEVTDLETLKKHQFVSMFIDVASVGMRDRKFWKVRYGGLLIVQSIVLRAGVGVNVGTSGAGDIANEKQLLLESILPHKETIQELAKKSLNDPEPKVTELATKILSVLSTWP